MKIIKVNYDNTYPFIIKGGWDDEVFCTLDNLKDLKEQIEKILKEEEKKA